ncbi:MAG: DUF4215 domain-containing protein [Patescibacteria group bacterium]
MKKQNAFWLMFAIIMVGFVLIWVGGSFGSTSQPRVQAASCLDPPTCPDPMTSACVRIEPSGSICTTASGWRSPSRAWCGELMSGGHYELTNGGCAAPGFESCSACTGSNCYSLSYDCAGSTPIHKPVVKCTECYKGLCGEEPPCGNGRLELEECEECDDSNTISGDGCSDRCEIEGTDPVCGNSKREGDEECDGDDIADCPRPDCECTIRCNDDCVCVYDPIEPECGNSIVEPPEQCDDGNTDDTDGCMNCMIQKGNCEPSGLCGNGEVTPPEQCEGSGSCESVCVGDKEGWIEYCGDKPLGACSGAHCEVDGASCIPTFDEDGMDNFCQGIPSCTGTIFCKLAGAGATCNPDSCMCEPPVTECGNGITEPPEQCDDGNNIDGDGCGSTCVIEGGGGDCGGVTCGSGEKCCICDPFHGMDSYCTTISDCICPISD